MSPSPEPASSIAPIARLLGTLIGGGVGYAAVRFVPWGVGLPSWVALAVAGLFALGGLVFGPKILGAVVELV